MQKTKQFSTQTMIASALLTAIVVVLQFAGAAIKIGTFSISLVLIPIVIGAITCGKWIGAWLGFVFGVVVLASGDAAPFMAVSIGGTVVTVLLKGTICGFVTGLVYEACIRLTSKQYLSSVISALICPVANTGVFLLGCIVFFMDTITGWGIAAGFGENVGKYIIASLVGINFLIELAVNIVFAPAIVRIVRAVSKK